MVRLALKTEVVKMAENTVENDLRKNAGSMPEKPGNDVVTVVLTADNHLGHTAFRQHPRKREEREQRLRHAFQQATDFAIGQGVDLFIQAGDLFDTVTPDERDRSFVAARLAQLKQAGIRTFALGGVHDTPADMQSPLDESSPAPQISYARLGALHYFSPAHKDERQKLEPVIVDIHGVLVGICGLGVRAGQQGDPLAKLRVESDIERAAIPILVLHAPIEGLSMGSSLLDVRARVSRESIKEQETFRYILAGYHHSFSHMRIGRTEVIVAGATQHTDFSAPDHAPGFVFMGLAADGLRWCNHIVVDALSLQRLVVHTRDIWPDNDTVPQRSPTEIILERLRPLCDAERMIQLRLEGELTRGQYHLLDLNQIRRYGEEHCFALAIDDSALSLLPEQEALSAETGERFSPREELMALADEWIAAAVDEREQRALRLTKEELLLAMDDIKGKK
jgi:DNA repair exonuclease SbcCD nuclease subunit